MAKKWLKRWRRYKHPYKGDIWSKSNPDEFKKKYGTGWVVLKTIKISDFNK